MTTRQLVWSVALALLVAGARGTRSTASAEDEEAKVFERVIYADTNRVSTVAKVELVSATEAEIVPRGGGKVVRGRWSVVAGPVLRVLAPDNEVHYFQVEDDALGASDNESLKLITGDAWHRAVTDDPTLRGRPDVFASESDEGFLLNPDGSADWVVRGGGGFATPGALAADGSLTLVLRDGKRRTFRREGANWREVGGALFVGARKPPPREPTESDKRLRCQQQLHDLVALFIAESIEKAGRPKYDGTALFLYYRMTHKIQPGAEANLRCPGDPHLRPLNPTTRDDYDGVDLSNPPLDLCSYAVRDFTNYPLDPESPAAQIIACCRQGRDGRTPHHKGGLNIAMDSGWCEFYTREELGLEPDAAIVVGPDSKHEWLRQVVQVPKRRR